MNQFNQKDFIAELNEIGKIFNHQFSRTKGFMRYSYDHEYSVFKRVRGELRLVDYYLKCINKVYDENFDLFDEEVGEFIVTNFKEYSFSSIQRLIEHLWRSDIEIHARYFAQNRLKEEREKFYSYNQTFNLSLPNRLSIKNIPKEMLFPKNHHLPNKYWTELSASFLFFRHFPMDKFEKIIEDHNRYLQIVYQKQLEIWQKINDYIEENELHQRFGFKLPTEKFIPYTEEPEIYKAKEIYETLKQNKINEFKNKILSTTQFSPVRVVSYLEHYSLILANLAILLMVIQIFFFKDLSINYSLFFKVSGICWLIYNAKIFEILIRWQVKRRKNFSLQQDFRFHYLHLFSFETTMKEPVLNVSKKYHLLCAISFFLIGVFYSYYLPAVSFFGIIALISALIGIYYEDKAK